ncbi:hypothetical protein DFH06DRAFT_1294210 [Mycena polygramma]|nr:hypothetical protein DFH06DRAFT_1294210 [Mycena polygramma]
MAQGHSNMRNCVSHEFRCPHIPGAALPILMSGELNEYFHPVDFLGFCSPAIPCNGTPTPSQHVRHLPRTFPPSLLPSFPPPRSRAHRHSGTAVARLSVHSYALILPLPRSQLFLPFGSPSGFPGIIKPTRRAFPTPPLGPEPPPAPSYLSQTSFLQAFLVSFTPLFNRKRRGFVLALFLVQRPHVFLAVAKRPPYKNPQFPSFGFTRLGLG